MSLKTLPSVLTRQALRFSLAELLVQRNARIDRYRFHSNRIASSFTR